MYDAEEEAAVAERLYLEMLNAEDTMSMMITELRRVITDVYAQGTMPFSDSRDTLVRACKEVVKANKRRTSAERAYRGL